MISKVLLLATNFTSIQHLPANGYSSIFPVNQLVTNNLHFENSQQTLYASMGSMVQKDPTLPSVTTQYPLKTLISRAVT